MLFGDEEPIGKRLRVAGDAPDVEIIGVVGTLRLSRAGGDAPDAYHSHRSSPAIATGR